jgi:hypothetical protein
MPRVVSQVMVISGLVLATALIAPWIGVPTAVVVMAVFVCGLVALNVATIGRQPA